MGSRISLRHFRCFVAVADAGSFTLAAGRLLLTQSSLTATVKQFEDYVGLKLFDRTTRRVELTRDAVWFKPIAEAVLRDFENAIGDLQAISKTQRGLIRIAAAPSMVTHVLAPTLVAFRKLYPDVRLQVTDAGSDRVERSVLSGAADFGISSRLNDFPDLDYTPVLTDPFGAVFPPGHLLASHEGPLTWEHLKKHDYVGLTPDTGIGAALETLPELGLPSREESHDRASSTTSLYALLKLGNRFSILPALAAHTTPLDEFEFRDLSEPRLNLEICLITRHLRSQSPSAHRFLTTLKDSIRASNYLYGAKAV